MIDSHIDEIGRIRDEGAIVIIKWDGARSQLRQTVVITRDDTDYVWRLDCDDIENALGEAIAAYRRAHSR
jgi:hypothetical protein